MTRRLAGREQALHLAVSPPAFNGLAHGGAFRPAKAAINLARRSV
jgi:hypothetical protein